MRFHKNNHTIVKKTDASGNVVVCFLISVKNFFFPVKAHFWECPTEIFITGYRRTIYEHFDDRPHTCRQYVGRHLFTRRTLSLAGVCLKIIYYPDSTEDFRSRKWGSSICKFSSQHINGMILKIVLLFTDFHITVVGRVL